jgi:hypothetical protein
MWYFVKDGAQQGPVSDEQLRSMARDGSLRGEDLVWQEGMPDWRPAMEIPGIEFRRELPQELPTMPIPAAPSYPPPAPHFEPEPHQMQAPPIQSPPMQAPPAQMPAQPYMQTPPVTGPGAATPYAPPRAHLGTGGADIPNYLVWSILVTLLCCVPGGIIGIIYSNKANSAKAMGDYAGALAANKTAKTWIIVSVVTWVVLVGLYVGLVVVGGAFSAFQQQ